jgi:glycine C-acetyltransferase
MYRKLKPVLEKELASIKEAGLLKRERIIASPQGAEINLQDGRAVINFCANN